MFPTVQGQVLDSLSARSDSFSPPDLKLVHSSESTNIESHFVGGGVGVTDCWGNLEHTVDSVGTYEVHVLT